MKRRCKCKIKNQIGALTFRVLRILTVAFVLVMTTSTLKAADVTTVERADGVESPEGGAETAYIYLEKEVAGAPGTQINIPVYIDQNPGIMGFKITMDYDAEIMKLTEITAGEITAKGSLVNNIGDSNQGTVIWSHVEAIEGPGILFQATFDIHKKAPEGVSKVAFSYSKEDTFNENYLNVALKFDNISIKVQEADSAKKKTLDEGKTKNMFLALGVAAILIIITLVIVVCVEKRRKKKGYKDPAIPDNMEAPVIVELPKVIEKPLFYGSITGIKGDYLGCTVNMKANEEITIGKGGGNINIVINENQTDISRKHCSVRYNEPKGLYEVTDYSKNGTLLNGNKLLITDECTMVPRGTILTLGHGNQVFTLN